MRTRSTSTSSEALSKSLHRLLDERVERHGARFVGCAVQIGLHPGRGHFQHLHRASAQAEAQRHRPAMDRRLGRRIDRRNGQRREGQARADIDHGGVGPGLEMFDQGRGHADGSEQVGLDGRDGEIVVHEAAGLVGGHDARVVDQHVHFRMGHHQPVRGVGYALRIAHVDLVGLHSRTGRGGFLQWREAAACDDDLVAEGMKGLARPWPMPVPPPVMKIVLPDIFMANPFPERGAKIVPRMRGLQARGTGFNAEQELHGSAS